MKRIWQQRQDKSRQAALATSSSPCHSALLPKLPLVRKTSPNHGVLGGPAVGRRLALVQMLADAPEQHECGIITAYYPKTGKHYVRFDSDKDEIGHNEMRIAMKHDDGDKHLVLLDSPDVNFYWLPSSTTPRTGTVTGTDSSVDQSSLPPLSELEVAIREDAVGRRLELFHEVRQSWCRQASILKYVDHCRQHVLEITETGLENGDGGDSSSVDTEDETLQCHCQHQRQTVVVVQLVDLAVTKWRFSDLRGPPSQRREGEQQILGTSKYMGVVRYTASAWKCHYTPPPIMVEVPVPAPKMAKRKGIGARRKQSKKNKSQLLPKMQEVLQPQPEIYIGCFSAEKDAALAYDLWARRDQAPVNFADRRICRAVLEHLKIREPKPPKASRAVGLVTTTSANICTGNEEKMSAMAVTASSKAQKSDTTVNGANLAPTLAEEMVSPSPVVEENPMGISAAKAGAQQTVGPKSPFTKEALITESAETTSSSPSSATLRMDPVGPNGPNNSSAAQEESTEDMSVGDDEHVESCRTATPCLLESGRKTTARSATAPASDNPLSEAKEATTTTTLLAPPETAESDVLSQDMMAEAAQSSSASTADVMDKTVIRGKARSVSASTTDTNVSSFRRKGPTIGQDFFPASNGAGTDGGKKSKITYSAVTAGKTKGKKSYEKHNTAGVSTMEGEEQLRRRHYSGKRALDKSCRKKVSSRDVLLSELPDIDTDDLASASDGTNEPQKKIAKKKSAKKSDEENSTLTTAVEVLSSSDESNTRKSLHNKKKKWEPPKKREKSVPENIFYSTSDEESDSQERTIIETKKACAGELSTDDQDVLREKDSLTEKQDKSDGLASKPLEICNHDSDDQETTKSSSNKKGQIQNMTQSSRKPSTQKPFKTESETGSSDDKSEVLRVKKPFKTESEKGSSDDKSEVLRVKKPKRRKKGNLTRKKRYKARNMEAKKEVPPDFVSDSLKTTELSRRKRIPKYPIGTRFIKEFPNHGFFKGEITAFDGEHYVAYYSADDDDEELSEDDFDDFEILSNETAPTKRRGKQLLIGLASEQKGPQAKGRKRKRYLL